MGVDRTNYGYNIRVNTEFRTAITSTDKEYVRKYKNKQWVRAGISTATSLGLGAYGSILLMGEAVSAMFAKSSSDPMSDYWPLMLLASIGGTIYAGLKTTNAIRTGNHLRKLKKESLEDKVHSN